MILYRLRWIYIFKALMIMYLGLTLVFDPIYGVGQAHQFISGFLIIYGALIGLTTLLDRITSRKQRLAIMGESLFAAILGLVMQFFNFPGLLYIAIFFIVWFVITLSAAIFYWINARDDMKRFSWYKGLCRTLLVALVIFFIFFDDPGNTSLIRTFGLAAAILGISTYVVSRRMQKRLEVNK